MTFIKSLRGKQDTLSHLKKLKIASFSNMTNDKGGNCLEKSKG